MKYTKIFKNSDIVYKKSCHDSSDETTYYFMYISEVKDNNYYLCKCHDISLEKIFHGTEIVLEKEMDEWRKDYSRKFKIQRILND